MTTTPSIEDIRALDDEAGQYGDLHMAAICQRALISDGDWAPELAAAREAGAAWVGAADEHGIVDWTSAQAETECQRVLDESAAQVERFGGRD